MTGYDLALYNRHLQIEERNEEAYERWATRYSDEATRAALLVELLAYVPVLPKQLGAIRASFRRVLEACSESEIAEWAVSAGVAPTLAEWEADR